jgi:integrase
MVETDLVRGTWFDPDAGDIRLDTYAPRWLAERPVELQPRTAEIYDDLLRRHIYPTFGATALNRITSAAVRSWHASLRESGLGSVTTAKAYRLLKAILATAVEDELLPRNPCRLKTAGIERSAERKPPSLAELELIVDAIEPRYRLLVLLGAWSGLRWGELCGLSRQRVDALHGVLHVVEALVELADGRRWIGPPHLWPAIEEHLETFVGPEPTALLFTKTNGTTLDRRNFHTMWRRATRKASVGAYHFHDLRHLAATMAAVSGATTRELMRRMGHASSRAALIYQHATEDRDRAVAEAMSRLVEPQPITPLGAVGDGQA